MSNLIDKYTFTHIGSDGYNNPIEITVTTEAGHIDNLVDAFRSFLLAVTFHNSTILNSMERLVEEYREEEK